LDVFWGLAGDLWEHIAELLLIGSGYCHAPETILDVQLAKEDGAFFLGLGADGVDDSAEGVSELVHGLGGGRRFISEFVD
jgi:hypothetical protein